MNFTTEFLIFFGGGGATAVAKTAGNSSTSLQLDIPRTP